MDIDTLIDGLVDDLTAAATPDRAAGAKQYLKSDLEFIGATVPTIRTAAKRLTRGHPDLGRDSVIRLVEGLWQRPVFELRATAVELLDLYRAKLKAIDIALIERMLRQSRTWALVDNLATSVGGPLVEEFPELGDVLDAWAGDEDFWIRRAAMLALLKPLRAGGGDFARFSRYADEMLDEKEFFIRKAIGWVLRDTSRKRPGLVAEWVGPRIDRMSGVTIREAVKNLPPEQAAEFMAAYREHRPVTSP
ncbi:MAG: DNA alkylation repair protein [Acidimicrobiia bacterium]|nr:DNA alkylation repair protein [Acidimicrobiia bacterium]